MMQSWAITTNDAELGIRDNCRNNVTIFSGQNEILLAAVSLCMYSTLWQLRAHAHCIKTRCRVAIVAMNTVVCSALEKQERINKAIF